MYGHLVERQSYWCCIHLTFSTSPVLHMSDGKRIREHGVHTSPKTKTGYYQLGEFLLRPADALAETSVSVGPGAHG